MEDQIIVETEKITSNQHTLNNIWTVVTTQLGIQEMIQRLHHYVINWKMEILMMILLIIIFVIILVFSNKNDTYLESLKPILSKILDKAGYHMIDHNIPIHLRKSKDRTYTIDKQKIYVVVDNPSGQRYNRDTLIFVLLHEIAHIISPDEHHTKGFHLIEKRLHTAAIELGYIRKDRLDKSYPCHK
jgi:beta-lactamase regulating signal transducer with metallopeptidase domain